MVFSLIATNQVWGYSASAASQLNVPLSVRQMGMGDVSAGVGDVLKAWLNPAYLVDSGRTIEFAATGQSLLNGLESTFGGGIRAMITPDLALGSLFHSFGFHFKEIDNIGNSTGQSIGRQFVVASAGAAYQWNWLRSGILTKYVVDRAGNDQVSIPAVDLGLAADGSWLFLGLAVRNVGPKLRDGSSDGKMPSESLPLELRTSCGLKDQGGVIAVEVATQRSGRVITGVGVEFWPPSIVGLRAGVADLFGRDREERGGLSFRFGSMEFNYALSYRKLGYSHRASLDCSFGSNSGSRKEEAGRLDAALASFLAELNSMEEQFPSRRQADVCRDAIRLTGKMAQPPPLPKKALTHFNNGMKGIAQAQDAAAAVRKKRHSDWEDIETSKEEIEKSKQLYLEAAQQLEKGLRLAPWEGSAYYNAGIVLELLGHRDMARSNYELFLFSLPDVPEAERISMKLDQWKHPGGKSGNPGGHR